MADTAPNMLAPGTPVWALDEAGMWREAAVLSVNEAQRTVECSLAESEADPDVLMLDDAAANPDDTQDFVPVRVKRRNSRRASLRNLHGVPIANVLPRNTTEVYHEVADLTKLVHLHEPAMLQVLRKRFFHGLIYTSTGSILVALNPFRSVDLYAEAIKLRYYMDGGDMEKAKRMPPHVYSVADKAFRTMLAGRADPSKVSNQTILVSGESGSGKTETTKLIMSYLAYVSSQRKMQQSRSLLQRRLSTIDNSTIHTRVLESNPILEAFGNARTNRNNNSSRFGKFIKLGFAPTGEMLGALISTYLLERVRLVSQSQGERNYHIFYEMLAGASKFERDDLRLGSVHDYKYLAQSDCVERLDGIDDANQYQQTRQAMENIGMEEEEQISVMRIVSAVLHLGNVEFIAEKGKDDSQVDMAHSADSIQAICHLLGVQSDVLLSTLSSKRIKAGAEFICVPLPVDEAQFTRDSIVKTLYSNLFNWLVDRINQSIRYKEEVDSQFIGVVDIFGFEIFEHNCLEQLCINYANEKLQQLFGRFVFRMEQDEYIAEEIPWQFVDYPNNDVCVAMLEARPVGLFSLLDEQCLMPRGNDEKLASKYYEVLDKQEAFSVTSMQRARRQFTIRHYAGDVTYSTEGFCDKNKDHMHPEAGELMLTSESSFVRMIFENDEATRKRSEETRRSSRRRSGGIMSSTVVSQFKVQLNSLLDTINVTEPHFIRCIKPNDVASSTEFDRKRLMEQLRCGGVLEAVKISRSGYPVRFLLEDFIKTYGVILGERYDASKDQKQVVTRMVAELTEKHLDPSHREEDGHPAFQVGKTKIFCLHHAYVMLETTRTRVLHSSVVTVQRYCIGYAYRRKYQRKRQGAIRIQSMWRCVRCRRRFVKWATRKHAAIKIQKVVRGHLIRRDMKREHAAVKLQACIRGWLVRREYAADTMSYDHDDSAASTPVRDSTEDSFASPVKGKMLDPLYSSAASTVGTDRTTSGSSLSRISVRRSAPTDYVPPAIKDEYAITWECGLLGLYFESDDQTGMPIVRRVHESLSNCADIFEVSRGDILLQVGNVKVRKDDIHRILQLLQEVNKPVQLRFRRNPTASERVRSDSLELLGEEDYEVLWREHVPLGLGFRPDPQSGYPAVFQANGNPSLPGMFNVRRGDYLIFINEFSTRGVRFQKVIDILETGPRPAVLRFRHCDTVEDVSFSNPQEDEAFMRQSCVSMNPKVDHSLYYITWKEEDGPLGIVVKQEASSYYPRVINVKTEGAVHRESQRNRVEIGDILLSINNNNISKMGFGAAMRLLQRGPKPLLLMFQRPRYSQSDPLAQSI